jgi:hypothetical protein
MMKQEGLPGPIKRYYRILHTIWLTYKQDRDFWNTDLSKMGIPKLAPKKKKEHKIKPMFTDKQLKDLEIKF